MNNPNEFGAPPQQTPHQNPQGQVPQGQVPQGQVPQGQVPQGQAPHAAPPYPPHPQAPQGYPPQPYAPPQAPPKSPMGLIIGAIAGLGLLTAVVALAAGLYLGARRNAASPAPVAAVQAPAASAEVPDETASSNGAASADASAEKGNSDAAMSSDASSTAPVAAPRKDAFGKVEAAPGKMMLQTAGPPNAPYTVYINGQKAKDYLRGEGVEEMFAKKFEQTDISSMVRPGENTMRVVWSKPVAGVSAKVARATSDGAFGDIVSLVAYDNLDPELKTPGEKTMTFVVPDPNDPASGPEPAATSRDNQLIIKTHGSLNNVVTLYLNGRKLGDVSEEVRFDISKMVKPGQNTLRMVPKQQKTLAWATVAYAKQKNQFGTVANMTLDTSAGEDKTLTFIAPSS